MRRDGDGLSREFHQGFNAAALIGIWVLGSYQVISGAMCLLLTFAVVGFYSWHHG